MNKHSREGFNPQPYIGKLSKSQLAHAYEVDLRTFNTWIKNHLRKIGRPYGRFYTPFQVQLIFQLIGKPNMQKLIP